MLDRIVGYQLSPLLWKKVRRGLSAGRVQSVATRLVVDRENEIRAFTPQEYWTIDAALDRTGKPGGFTARYYGDPKKNDLGNREDVDKVLAQIAGKPLYGAERQKNAAPEKSRAALYYLQPSAGGLETELDAEAHDDARPAAL
ncbi:MAG: DNA topoisomerase [Oscillospiraceae bacterium]